MNDTLGEASAYYLRNAISNISANHSAPSTPQTHISFTPTTNISTSGLMSVANNEANIHLNVQQTANNITDRRSSMALTPSNRASPNTSNELMTIGNTDHVSSEPGSEAPSPDEMIIRCKGRRSFPLQWSPIALTSPQKLARVTPTKFNSGKQLRSSPRKRLQLNDISYSDLVESRRSLLSLSPMPKRTCLAPPSSEETPDSLLQQASKHQLISVLSSIMNSHPEIHGEIKSLLAQPDVKALEDDLRSLKKEIFKSLPTSRLASKTDARAFCRAVPHIAAFKKAIEDQGTYLLNNEKWDDLLNYSMFAWSCVRLLPKWDSPAHFNCTQRVCYKLLTGFCRQSLEKVNKDEATLDKLKKKLSQYKVDYSDFQSCMDYLESQEDTDHSME